MKLASMTAARLMPRAARLARPASEGVDTRQLPPDHELVDGLRALVGDHALEVEHVADRAILGADAGAAEDVARIPRDVQRHARIVPLGERDLLRPHPAGVLEPSDLQRRQLD